MVTSEHNVWLAVANQGKYETLQIIHSFLLCIKEWSKLDQIFHQNIIFIVKNKIDFAAQAARISSKLQGNIIFSFISLSIWNVRFCQLPLQVLYALFTWPSFCICTNDPLHKLKDVIFPNSLCYKPKKVCALVWVWLNILSEYTSHLRPCQTWYYYTKVSGDPIIKYYINVLESSQPHPHMATLLVTWTSNVFPKQTEIVILGGFKQGRKIYMFCFNE